MGNQYRINLTASLDNLSDARLFVEDTAGILNIDPDTTYDLVFAVNELVTNTIIHGYKKQPGEITIEMWQNGGAIHVRIQDKAPPFDPRSAAQPDISLRLEERPLGGVGIYLTKQSMDEILYHAPDGGGNEVTLIKNLNSNSPKDNKEE